MGKTTAQHWSRITRLPSTGISAHSDGRCSCTRDPFRRSLIGALAHQASPLLTRWNRATSPRWSNSQSAYCGTSLPFALSLPPSPPHTHTFSIPSPVPMQSPSNPVQPQRVTASVRQCYPRAIPSFTVIHICIL